MTGELYISANSSIKNRNIYSGNQLVLSVADDIPVSDFLLKIYEQLQINYPKFYKMDVLSKAGMLGTEVLLTNFDRTKYADEAIGIVLMNRNASIEADAKYWNSVAVMPSPALFVYTLPNIVIGEISIKHKCKGESAFFIQDQFDAQWLHYYVSDIMNRYKTEACICGWVDVIENTVDACFFLIEKQKKTESVVFSPQNLDYLYQN